MLNQCNSYISLEYDKTNTQKCLLKLCNGSTFLVSLELIITDTKLIVSQMLYDYLYNVKESNNISFCDQTTDLEKLAKNFYKSKLHKNCCI